MSEAITYNATPTGRAFHLAPKDYEFKGVRGPVGCLPCWTEVMTPRGWVRIDEWRDGDELLEYNSASGEAAFCKPKRYIEGACGKMLRFECGRHMAMTVTENHRVALYDWAGRFRVKSAAEVAARPSKHRVPTVWWAGRRDGIRMSEDELRLWVAIAADGYYPKRGKQCCFCLRKERKVERLTALLNRMGIDYRVTASKRKDCNRERRIVFARPGHPKHFDWRLAKCSRMQAAVVIEELRYWDGLYASDETRFYSTDKGDVDIVQFLAHSCGRNATISKDRDKRFNGWHDCYTVFIAGYGSPKNSVMLRGDNLKVSEVVPEDGKQYCFETGTGFFVVRQEGRIFITGNSGKSVMCCFDIFLSSREQNVFDLVEDGEFKRVRWSNWLVGRHTFPALQKTTIPTFLAWFGGQTTMHWGQPLSGRYELPLEDGTLLRIDLVFAALESKNILNDLMSLELSGAFVNEATQVPWRVIDRIHDRIGRFNPVPGFKGKSFGVIMDTNSPDETNWWYLYERVKKPKDMRFFVQPPAMLKRERDGNVWYERNDGRDFKTFGIMPAENIENLPEGWKYYEKQIPTKSDDDIKKLILNEFGTSIDGRPVYPEWKDNFHYRNEVIPMQRGLTLLLGSDFGRTPATVIAQMGSDGVLYVLDEVRGENMGAEQFIEELLRPKLINEYNFPHCSLINFGDPAGQNANEVVNISAINKFNQYGILTKPAPGTNGNRVQIRIDTVSELLRRSWNGRAAVQVSSKCEFLRKGFNGHYCYRRIRTGVEGDERYTEEPDKNEYSHIHDAFQYLCMGIFKSGVDYSMPTSEMRAQQAVMQMETGVDFDCL